MTANMGITRSAEQLEQALQQIQDWQHWSTESKVSQLGVNNASSPTTANELLYFQLERQLTLATLIIQSAYQRFESRGGHYRQDYPNLATAPLTSVVEPQHDPAYDQFSYFALGFLACHGRTWSNTISANSPVPIVSIDSTVTYSAISPT